jgi:hypothetical protein
MSDKSPPWVLFTDRGKPVAILPAGRPGEVMNVNHLTMNEAREIVRAGNHLYRLLTVCRLNRLTLELGKLADELSESTTKFNQAGK